MRNARYEVYAKYEIPQKMIDDDEQMKLMIGSDDLRYAGRS